MQLRAAKSLCTNFFCAKYSIPLATWSPKPIRSLTVGFWGGKKTRLAVRIIRTHCVSGLIRRFSGPQVIAHPVLAAYEVTQVSVLHVGQHH